MSELEAYFDECGDDGCVLSSSSPYLNSVKQVSALESSSTKCTYHQNTKQQSCLIAVSVGQPYHEGNAFSASTALIKNTFGSCVIVIADSLQAYNYIINDPLLEMKEAREKAKESGTVWLKNQQNKQNVEALPLSHDVIRWDSLLEHPEYQQHRDFLHSLYTNKEERKKLNKQDEKDRIKLEFSSAIDKTIGKRLSKIKASMDSNLFDQERIADLCKQYIMEDLAGRLLLAKDHRCHFEAYPNDRNAAATVIQKYYIKGSLQWLKIKFGDLKQRIKKIKDKTSKENTNSNKDDLSQLKNQLLLLKADTKKQNREGQKEINEIREQARQEIKKIQYRENKLNNAIDEAEEELLRAEGNGGKQEQVNKCKEKIKEIQKELAIIGAEKKELQILRGGRKSPKLSVADNHSAFFSTEDTSSPLQPTAPTSSDSSLSSEDSSSDLASLSSSPNEEETSPLQTKP